MTRVRITRAAVLAAAVAVAAGVVLLFGGDARVQHPESTPAPSTAPAGNDGLSPGSSDSTVGGAVAPPSAGTTRTSEDLPDPEPVESEPAKDDAEPVESEPAKDDPEPVECEPAKDDAEPVECEPAKDDAEPVECEPAKDDAGASTPDPGFEFALEIVEAVDSDFELAGGARQESPVESTGPDESGGSGGGVSSAQGEVYTWHDGDRTVGARLQTDLVALDDGAIVSSDEILVGTSNGENVPRDADGDGKPDGASGSGGSDGSSGGTSPVFLSESGELMTLPGGIVVVLDPEWDADEAAAFFTGNGIAVSRVSSLDYLTNGFFVQTDPGFASLDLANALAGQVGVELSSPNWWRERTAR